MSVPTAFTPGAAFAAGRWAAAALLACGLVACGGGGGSGGGSSNPPPGPVTVNEAGIATAQSGEVLGYVKRKLQARGPQGSLIYTFGDAPAWLHATTTASGTVARSGTLVQEAGVDEDDLIKTDGSRIYTLAPLQPTGQAGSGFARLAIYTRDAAGKPQAAGAATLTTDSPSWTFTRGMLLADELPRVAVIGEVSDPVAMPDCQKDEACITGLLPYRPTTPRVHLQLLDTSQPDKLPAPERLLIDGRLVGTRQIGRTLYLVATHAPRFAFDLLPTTASDAEKRAALDRLSIADVLPQISVNGGPRVPLVNENDCWLQPANASTRSC